MKNLIIQLNAIEARWKSRKFLLSLYAWAWIAGAVALAGAIVIWFTIIPAL